VVKVIAIYCTVGVEMLSVPHHGVIVTVIELVKFGFNNKSLHISDRYLRIERIWSVNIILLTICYYIFVLDR